METCPISLPVLFTVPGVPVPKGRPRVTRAGITYTPRETLNYEAQVRVAEQHDDFFVKNMVVILAEERLALTLYRPEAFVVVTLDHAPGESS